MSTKKIVVASANYDFFRNKVLKFVKYLVYRALKRKNPADTSGIFSF